MSKRTLFVSLLALGISALGVFAVFGGKPESPPPTSAPAAGAAPKTAAPAPSGAATGGSLEVAAGPTEATATRDYLALPDVQPLPDDASWLELLVVDGEGAPIPGADVYWYDQSAWLRLEQRGDLVDDEVEILWQRPERMIRYAGWQTHSDAEGRARVTIGAEGVVAGVAGDRYGKLPLLQHMTVPPGGLRLVLEPDQRVTVHVRDDLDQPCTGVPVTLAVFDQDDDLSGPFGRTPMAHTDARGVAVIEHLQECARTLRDQGWIGSRHRVTVRTMVAGWPALGTPIDLDALPADPIVLRLPACGSVRARLCIDGQPVAGTPQFALYCADGNNHEWPQARADASGWAHFDRVVVGKEYVVATNSRGAARLLFTGPGVRDQEVVVTVTLPADAVQLRGRLLDADRRPLADRRVRLRAHGDRFRGRVDFATQPDGRFHVSIGTLNDADAGAAEVRQLTFEVFERKRPPLRAELAPRILRKGVDDVGDVVLTTGEALVAGRLVASGEPFRGEITVHVERAAADPDARRPWLTVHHGPAETAGDGSFVVYQQREAQRYRLRCFGKQVLPMQPVEFAPGTTDLLVELQLGLPLAASVLLPPDTPIDLMVFELVPMSADTPGVSTERRAAAASPLQGCRHGLEWGAVPPGDYALEVRDWTSSRPTVRIPDVQVPAPATGDPRLVDIDLQSLLRVVTVDVFDPDGKPIEGEGAIFLAGLRPNDEWRGIPLWSERVRLVLPPGPADLLVTVPGYRPTPLFGNADRLAVRLQPWPTLEVTVADVPPLPDDVSVWVNAAAIGFESHTWSAPWSTEPIGPLLGGTGVAAEVEGGRATVRCSDGPQRLNVTVAGSNGSETLRGVAPAEVLSTTGSVVLRAPAAEWQRVLAKVAPAPK